MPQKKTQFDRIIALEGGYTRLLINNIKEHNLFKREIKALKGLNIGIVEKIKGKDVLIRNAVWVTAQLAKRVKVLEQETKALKAQAKKKPKILLIPKPKKSKNRRWFRR